MENETIGDIFRTRGAIVLFHVNVFLVKSVDHLDFYNKKYTKYFDCVPKFNKGKNVIGKTWSLMQLRMFERLVSEKLLVKHYAILSTEYCF